jgi:hypothetical protein
MFNGELQGIAPLAFPHVGLHRRPSKLHGSGDTVMTIGQQQKAVDVEHDHGRRFIKMRHVIRNLVRVQMLTTPLKRVLNQVNNWKVNNRHPLFSPILVQSQYVPPSHNPSPDTRREGFEAPKSD